MKIIIIIIQMCKNTTNLKKCITNHMPEGDVII